MPVYQTTPFKPSPTLLVPGIPEYVFGSYNDKTGPTLGYVQSNSAAATTGTLVFRIVSGNVPIMGALITVIGTANSTGVFNVTNATIITVTCTDAGICTVTYAVSSTTQASLADGGQVSIPQPEIGERFILTGGESPSFNENSVPVVMPYGDATSNLNQAITVVVSFPSLPTTGVVTLQQAIKDIDSEYATVATVATVTGGAVTAAGSQITVDPTLGRFFRLHSEGTGGTLPTIVGKIMM